MHPAGLPIVERQSSAKRPRTSATASGPDLHGSVPVDVGENSLTLTPIRVTSCRVPAPEPAPCPAAPYPAQSAASRQNGARSGGPATDAGKARAALNGVRHGLTARTFFLLPDEDPAEFQRHEAMWLAVWSPRDLHEHEAAATAIRAMWREIRADRLEAQVLTDLFAAGELADAAEAQAAKDKAFQSAEQPAALQGPDRARAPGGDGGAGSPARAPARRAGGTTERTRADNRPVAVPGDGDSRPRRRCEANPSAHSTATSDGRCKAMERQRSRLAA